MKMNKSAGTTAGTSLSIMSFLVLTGAVLFAQQVASVKPVEPKYTEVKYSADGSSYRWDGDDRVLMLKGNVKFVQGDTTIQADRVDYREKEKTATAEGNLKIFNPESTVTGTKCVVSFKDKKGTITGNVNLVSHAKPKPADSKVKSELRDEVTVTCAAIDYYYKDKKAVIPAAVTIVQKNRKITADSATYFGKEDRMLLTGNVKGQDENERHAFSSPKVTISLKDNDQWMEAEKATGSFYVKDEEEEPGKPSEKPAEKPADTSKDKPGK